MSAINVLSIDQEVPDRAEADLKMPTADANSLPPSTSVALLRSMLRPLGQELRVSRLPLDLFESESYRIGLIPIENLTQQTGPETLVLNKINSVVVLPLTWRELVVHVRAEVSQAKCKQPDDVVRFGVATINFARMEAERSGTPVPLTGLQFKVLHYFVRNPRRVISREELLNNVWGYNHYPSTRTVDNVVLRLRQTLEPNPSKPVHFYTIHSIGYKFTP